MNDVSSQPPSANAYALVRRTPRPWLTHEESELAGSVDYAADADEGADAPRRPLMLAAAVCVAGIVAMWAFDQSARWQAQGDAPSVALYAASATAPAKAPPTPPRAPTPRPSRAPVLTATWSGAAPTVARPTAAAEQPPAPAANNAATTQATGQDAQAQPSRRAARTARSNAARPRAARSTVTRAMLHGSPTAPTKHARQGRRSRRAAGTGFWSPRLGRDGLPENPF